ncbi:MAG: glucosaminidase domain-containing protein [Pseudomonadota bacterium]
MSLSRQRREWLLHLAMVLAVVLPLLLAALLARYGLQHQPEPDAVVIQPVALAAQQGTTASQVEALFARHDYHWPPAQEVPALALKQLPTGLDKLPVERKKGLFFRILLPLVLAENRRLAAEREWLLTLQREHAAAESERLSALAQRYRLDDPRQPAERLMGELLQRVDIVPPGLVLAQAANESGWGTSRFSREANNLFGEWTWDEEQGVLPANRPEGASHYVRRFGSLRDSVRAYMHNLNSGPAYDRFRRMRAQMRAADEALDPHRLAEGLLRYSARGEAYIREIQSMIRGNGLNTLGPLDLAR